MQQAYQALRVISEAQTVHLILDGRPGTLMLDELCAACAALQERSSDGIKAVVLDFATGTAARNADMPDAVELERARAAVRAIPQPVLLVVRAGLAESACTLLAEADFTLVAHEAELCLPEFDGKGDNSIGGKAAARLGYATWSTPAAEINREMERILDMLRAKSALALRHARASVRLHHSIGTNASDTADSVQLEALQRINQFYLEKVTTTQDAQEGLTAFLEKRAPRWHNR